MRIRSPASLRSTPALPHLPQLLKVRWARLPASPPVVLRAIFGSVVLAGILTGAVGCDKHRGRPPVVVRKTSLAGKPAMLFLLFGDRTDLRLLPVAMTAQGRIVPITLDHTGWRKFDDLYFGAGTVVPVYRDGAVVAQGHVTRGMWSGDGPLYKLPGCESLRPLAAVTVDSLSSNAPIVELLATSAQLPLPVPRAAPDILYLDSARVLTAQAAQRQGINRVERGYLALSVRAIHTGASASPTLVGAYVEQTRGTAHRARQIFVLGDSTAAGYAPTLLYVARDSAAEFHRYIDHLDLNGDGIDEIVLEGTRDGGESYLAIMQFVGGKWKESARTATSWCGDTPPDSTS
jgi:hypothetical protein